MEEDSNSGAEMTAEITTAPKRPRGHRYSADRSAVWDHFTYNIENQMSKCNYCSYSTKDKLPSNLQKHLKQHPLALAAVEEKTAQKRSTASSSSSTSKSLLSRSSSSVQTKLTEHLGNKKKMYDKGNKKYKDLLNAVSILFASQSLPHLLIESPEFKYFVNLLDPKFELPNRRRLPIEISNIYERMKERILSELKNVKKICVVLVIWTKKGLSESYLGILVKYFELQSVEKKTALIALKKMQGSHTGQSIKETLQMVLDEWKISEDQISFYVTDNGSNMIKALKECVIEFVPTIQQLDKEGETEDLLMFEMEGDFNLDSSFIEEESDNDTTEFEQLEEEHNSIFGYSKRIACVAHQLMCIVRKCIDKSQILKPILQSAFALVKAITKSTKNKELLIAYNNGRGLLSSSQTRWIYTYYVLKRLIESKESVEKVVIDQGLFEVALAAAKWTQIQDIFILLEPFASAVNKLEGDTYSTLSKVIPTLIDLIAQMNERAKVRGNFGNIAATLKRELENRSSYILNFSDAHFQPAYILSTFFDPEFVVGLSREQCNNCIQLIIKELMQNDSIEEETATINNELDNIPKKYVGFFKRSQTVTAPIDNDRAKFFKVKLDSYVDEIMTHGARSVLAKENPALAYWLAKRDVSPEIAYYAIDLLIVPASSAGIERVFSLAGIVQNRRYRLGAESTEKELLIKVNRTFLIC